MDIDVDVPSSFKGLEVFPEWIPASVITNGELRVHPCGLYPQTIEKDPITQLAAAPYKLAESLGYMKIDFLHNSIYDYFDSKEEIDTLLKIEPEWNLLLIPSVQQKLFHLSRHGDIIDIIRPKNIEELADILALIRPGKRQILDVYQEDRLKARRMLYSKSSKYYFKRSHAIGYAMVVVIQLHLIHMGVI